MKRTVLYSEHQKLNAKCVDFAGWEMPLHYGSQLNEHRAVREHAGMFDVSHMALLTVEGDRAREFLRYLLANDISKIDQGNRALYSCMLNAKGGILDDLIVYHTQTGYKIIVNAGTATTDLAWMQTQAMSFDVTISHLTDYSILAVQGPEALSLALPLLPTEIQTALRDMKRFGCVWSQEQLVARTGYTGESGLEIALPNHQAVSLWQDLIQAGVTPCGLGARDSLRLEAGLNLYGSDMDEKQTPLTSNLAWTVDWQDESRTFMGKSALQQQKNQGIPERLIHVQLADKGMLRAHQYVWVGEEIIGELTSASFTPMTGRAVAFARIKSNIDVSQCEVESRGKRMKLVCKR